MFLAPIPWTLMWRYAQKRAASDKWTFYYLTVAQISAYAQDEWKIGKNFRLTYGLRADKPAYTNASFKDPQFNADGSFKGTYTEGSPTLPNNDNQVLFDASGKKVTNGVGKELDNSKFPTTKVLFSPRIGFNWDVNGNKTFQVRGGSGLFTGRFPFVWLGNQLANPYTGFYNVTASDFRWPQTGAATWVPTSKSRPVLFFLPMWPIQKTRKP